MPMVTNLHHLITRQQGWLNTSRPLEADDLQNRIILLDFWTYCCINCIHVMPDLKFLEGKYGNKLTVIGVHSAKFRNERDSENIRQAILRYDLHHPVVNDFDFSTWQAFGVRAWPTLILINPKGIVQAVYSGEGHRNDLVREIDYLIRNNKSLNTSPLPIALEKDKMPASVLSFPAKLAYTDDLGGAPALFVSDSGHNRIVAMRMDGSIFTSIGNGQAGYKNGNFAQAQFHSPQGVLFASGGKDHVLGVLYVADTENHAIRAIDFDKSTVSTIAGSGKQGFERAAKHYSAETSLSSPWDLAFYPDSQHIVIAMAGTHQLWSYDLRSKTLDTIAGSGREELIDGSYPNNALAQTSGLSAMGKKLYFVDAETSSLRVLENGEVTTLIGTGLFEFGYHQGVRGEAQLQHPLGVFATDSDIYVADSYNHSIRRYEPSTLTLYNFAGHGVRGEDNGDVETASFNEPNAIIKVGRFFYIADTNNNAIRVIDTKSGKVSTLNVREEKQPSAPTASFSESLPNVADLPPATIAANKAATIAIALNDGWHINDEAPSSLAVFDSNKKPVAAFEREQIKSKSLPLPALKPGTYRLQATLYYCEDKEGAQCLLKSLNLPIEAKDSGGDMVTLPLN